MFTYYHVSNYVSYIFQRERERRKKLYINYLYVYMYTMCIYEYCTCVYDMAFRAHIRILNVSLNLYVLQYINFGF